MSYQLDCLIRDLTRIRKNLPPETEVRIAVEGHWYDLYDIMFNETSKVGPEHTCDQDCICTEADDASGFGDQHFNSTNTNCLYCYCEGCASDEPVEFPEVYLTLGDQHAYDLPHLVNEEAMLEVIK